MFGCTNDTLFIEAASLALLGPWQFWVLAHGVNPSPTVKKNRLSTLLGTFAGNFEFAKLWIFLLKIVAKFVLLKKGNLGFSRRSFGVLAGEAVEDGWLRCWYWRVAAVVEWSKAPGPVA